MPQPGELLGGRYRLDDRIAAGGMGEVWQATDTVLKRGVAVKTLLADRAADRGFQRRFQHEARALAALRHPGVVTVYDFGSTEAEDAYLVMARVDGEPLNRMLARRGRLTPSETMSVVAQAAQALEAAHKAGIVHRDVKPGNLLVEPDGTVVLVDFGVARSAHSGTVTGAGEVVGTALYIAPEQVARQETGPAADVYALGALAYHCLAGHPPFQGTNPIAIALQHLDEDPPPLPDDIPADVCAVVRTAMAKNPANRFPSAGSMAQVATSAATGMTRQPAGAAGTGDPANGNARPDTPELDATAPDIPVHGTTGSDAGTGDPANGNTRAGIPEPDATAPDIPVRATTGSDAGNARLGIPVDGTTGSDARSGSGVIGDRYGLAATKAGAPWIGVVGMSVLDATSDEGDYDDDSQTYDDGHHHGDAHHEDAQNYDDARDPGNARDPGDGTGTQIDGDGTGTQIDAFRGAEVLPATAQRIGAGGYAAEIAETTGTGTPDGSVAGRPGAETAPQQVRPDRSAMAAVPGTATAGPFKSGSGRTGDGTRGARPATPVIPAAASAADDRPHSPLPDAGTGSGARKRRLLPVLVLAAVVLFGAVGTLLIADPFKLFVNDLKPTLNAPAAPPTSAGRSSSAKTGGANAGEVADKPEKTERNQDAGTRSPSPAATRPAQETPATTEPAGEATTGTTPTPEQTTTSPPETEAPDENENETDENEAG
ncbi:protein kinase [Actinoplanes sp. NPDC023801]|uniref:serine/threonine-protein kinase n=1 Tax=Actinoplanes sp. NPDC023801 TaxID=3154595 RepID=UPI0033E5364E